MRYRNSSSTAPVFEFLIAAAIGVAMWPAFLALALGLTVGVILVALLLMWATR